MLSSSLSTRLCTMLGALVVLLCISPARAVEADKALQLRAAFLLNFVRFTEWPEEALPDDGGEFVVAVLGTDPFGDVLEQTFRQQTAQARGIKLRRFRMPYRRDYDDLAEYKEALNKVLKDVAESQVVYMNLRDSDEATSLLKQFDSKQTLIVGHSKVYAEQGAHLALDRTDENIVFYANIDAIKESELDVSSKLLKLARVIKTRDGGN